MPKGVYVRRNRNPPKRRKPSTRPDYYRKVVMTTGLVGDRVRSRTMAAREAARQQGRRKGGLKTQALGLGHRWTSETAREAARALWARKRHKPLGSSQGTRLGVRIGLRSNRRKPVLRAPLREHYAQHVVRGIAYIPADASTPGFWSQMTEHGIQRISERTALTKLGHLRPYTGYVPDTIVEVPRGTQRAGTGTNNRN
jgi:hypothetical protein